jgi:homopolymeric O-antigen transport system permease protein
MRRQIVDGQEPVNRQANNAEPALIVVRHTSGWIPLKLKELWEYRELIYFLAWRDLKVRYRQTILGVFWVMLQPLLMTLVFSLVFGRFAAIPASSSDIPYPIFALCGLLAWQFFSYVLANSTNSLVASERLITKIYFPRLVIPLSGMLSGLVDFAIAFILLLVMMMYYRVAPTTNVWILPAFLVMIIAHAVGMGLWLAAMNLQYRDVRYVVPFISQLWFFTSPVVYPINFIPDNWRWLYAINPMVGVIGGIRWSLFGSIADLGLWLCASVSVAAVILVSGLYYFRRMERDFADFV